MCRANMNLLINCYCCIQLAFFFTIDFPDVSGRIDNKRSYSVRRQDYIHIDFAPFVVFLSGYHCRNLAQVQLIVALMSKPPKVEIFVIFHCHFMTTVDEVSILFSKNTQKSTFMKIRPVRTGLLQEDRQTGQC